MWGTVPRGPGQNKEKVSRESELMTVDPMGAAASHSCLNACSAMMDGRSK